MLLFSWPLVGAMGTLGRDSLHGREKLGADQESTKDHAGTLMKAGVRESTRVASG